MRFRRLWRPIAVVLGVIALAAGACSAGDKPSASSSRQTADGQQADAATVLPRLHVERGDRPRFVDESGREVLLRGVNVNALGEYFQADPNLAATIPLTDEDWAQMATLGFDAVRLIVSWSRLEPQRGVFDQHYVSSIHDAVDRAKANGLYVILDMHQDAWGMHIATPPGTSCPEGLEPAIGWDGAPAWATITDGAETCRQPGNRDSAAAVQTAFQSFYDDRDGIRTELEQTWGHLAREFAGEPAVAGYDLFNEPNAVGDLQVELPKYTAFVNSAIAAIRAAETAGDGFHHIVFVEPIILFPLPNTVPEPGFSTDPNLAFAPHQYWESIVDILTIEQGFDVSRDAAAKLGMPYWVGEYGWWSTSASDLAELRRYARAEDAAFVGSSWWQWRQACGDPHSIGVPGGVPDDQYHLHTLLCPEDNDQGITQAYATVLSRTYPRATPGQLTELTSDPDARTAHIAGNSAGAGAEARLVVWVPDRGHGMPVVGGHNVADVTTTATDGGWFVSATVGCSYSLDIDGPTGAAITDDTVAC
jgi:endoglycosylceramidase